MSTKIVAPSLLAADFSDLTSAVKMVDESKADWLHLDVMDGVFVPNISFGVPVIQSIRNKTDKVFDVHLMIVEPDKYIETFKNIGADVLTVHYEASTHLHRTLSEIKNQGMKAGVALNPHTPVHLLSDIINDIDLLCLMSVNPGFGGQKFIQNTYQKVREARELIEKKGASTWIEIDGGVNTENAPKLVEAGANVLVAGSSVFGSDDPKATIEKMLL